MGPGGGDGSPGPRGFPKPGQAAWATSAAGIHDTMSGTAFCLVSVACLTSLSLSLIVNFNICTTLSASTYNLVCTEALPGFC